MRILSAKETKATALQKKLIEKKNLFGLGLTSLIAACSADGEGAGGGGGKTPAGPIGKIPENPVPEKLTAAGQLAEASAERLAPVADIDNGHISASTTDSVEGNPAGRAMDLKDLVVTIEAASGLVKADFEMTFKNGNHTAASAFVSVYQRTGTDKYDLVVTSADFGGPSGTNILGAIYFVWDIGSRDNTTLDTANPNNFLWIEGSSNRVIIGQYAPEFFHIGGGVQVDTQYDMTFGADYTANGMYSQIYIVWDITRRAGDDAGDKYVSHTPTSAAPTIITSNPNEKINEHSPEFFHIGGVVASSQEQQHDMVIRSEGGTGAIYILWDVAAYYDSNSDFDKKTHVTVSLSVDSTITKGLLKITGVAGENIGKHSPEFLQIGGVDAGNAPQQDMVIRSDDAAGTGAIYILWDVAAYYDNIDIGNSSFTFAVDLSSAPANGLLKITGAAGENIGKHSSELFQLTGTDTPDDMVIRSDDGTGAIYILWDVAAYYNSDSPAIPKIVNLSDDDTIEKGSLKITGENIGAYSPEFLQIGGTVNASSVAQQDMIIRSDTAIYVLWDVAAYYSTASTPIDLSGNSVANGLLKITDTTGEKIGQNAPDILKINNNDDYDMIIKSDANMYVLWDFTKDYSTTPASVSLTDASAATGNGLLTISGAGTANILKDDSTGFADIDGKGINDIVFTYEGNTFILFGEKVADRYTNEKAVSHEVDMGNLTGLSGSADGYFGYDGVDSIGYRFAGVETNLAAVALPSTSLSDADGVWDIA